MTIVKKRQLFYYAPTHEANVGVNVGVKLSDIQTKVIALIKTNPSITHAEIARTLSITQRTVERATKKLRDGRIITREGSDKTGIWKVFSNHK